MPRPLPPLLAAAIGMALGAALLLSLSTPFVWAVVALMAGLALLQARQDVDPQERAWTRRWLLPTTLGAYLAAAVYVVTGAFYPAAAAGFALVALVWLGLFLRERRGGRA